MNDRLPFGSPFLSTLASSRFRRLLVLAFAVATLLLLAVGSGSAHSLTAVDGNDSDWLAGFGAAGCPSLPGANSASLYSTSNGCTLPGGAKGTEYIWTDTLGDQRTDHWSGTGNLDLTQFRMTATETHLNFLLRFSDITNCNAQYIAIAVNSGTGGTNFFPDNAETNLPFEYERVVEVNTNATGYWTNNTTFTSAGSSFCNDTANLWEIQMPLSGLGLSYPFASGQYDFAAAIFCRDTGGTICEAGGSDAMDAITTVGGNTFNEVGDGTLNYSFTTALNDPVDVQITKSGPSSADLGAQVEYTLTFVNNGPGTATGVVVMDDIPSQLTNVSYTVTSQSDPATTVTARPSIQYIWDVSNLGMGDTVTIKVTGTLDPDTPLTSFDNEATISTTADDTSAGNNSSSTTLTPTDPAQPGPTFTVNSTADTNDGRCGQQHCTLREAINAANARTNTDNDATSGADPDQIHFDIPGSGVQTITPNSSGQGALPSVTDAVVIDGTTQSGASCAPWPATLLVQVSGSSLAANSTMLTIAASNSTVRGLVLNGTNGTALGVTGSSNRVECNFVGTNAAGTSAIANTLAGVFIQSGASNNIIGTNGVGMADEAERNLISGNNLGVAITGSGSNRVAGNYIGTNATGTSALPNSTGVTIQFGASSNIIGTNGDGAGDEAERNLISGNGSYGVWFFSSGSSNRVAGNYIGTNAAGTGALPNVTGVSILNGASNNLIGGALPVEQNTIAYNTNDGVVSTNGT
ncbi:MAG TPA: CSLREA domain-containing protein, partial [Ardenticatenaceae bacterium]